MSGMCTRTRIRAQHTGEALSSLRQGDCASSGMSLFTCTRHTGVGTLW